jgi:hypothetical protein
VRWWSAIVLAGIACTRPAGGRIEASRTSATDSGRLAAPAAAEWCAAGKFVEIVAIQGDTGLAIELATGDTIRPGEYPIAETPGDSARDTAAVALRWPRETSIRGFQGDKGTLVLRRDADASLSGKVDATGRLKGAGRPRLTLTATFQGLSVRAAATTCASSVDSGNGDHLLPEGIRPQGGD